MARRRRARPRRRAAKSTGHAARPAKAPPPLTPAPPARRWLHDAVRRRARSTGRARLRGGPARRRARRRARRDARPRAVAHPGPQVTRAEAGTVYVRRGEVLEFAVVQNDVLARQVGEEEVRRRRGGQGAAAAREQHRQLRDGHPVHRQPARRLRDPGGQALHAVPRGGTARPTTGRARCWPCRCGTGTAACSACCS